MSSLRHLAPFGAAFLFACGSDPQRPGESAPDAGVSSAWDAATPIPGDTISERLIGDYALRTILATIQTPPFVGDTPATSISYGVARIEPAGEGVALVEAGCRVELRSSGLASASVPDALPRSIPPRPFALQITEEGDRIRVVRPEAVTLAGVRLADEVNEALPTEPDDPRVFDQDGDGKPGVTVRMSGLLAGEVYLVQRMRAAYDTVLGADGSLAGGLVDRTQQEVIGASSSILDTAIPTRQDPDPSKSEVRLVRLGAPLDCEALLAQKDALFPALP